MRCDVNEKLSKSRRQRSPGLLYFYVCSSRPHVCIVNMILYCITVHLELFYAKMTKQLKPAEAYCRISD